MKWIVQKNFVGKTFSGLVDSIVRMGCDVTWVHTYPFVDKIFDSTVTVDQIDIADEIEIDLTIPTIGIGSIKLNRLLDERGVQPGGFRNEESITLPNWMKGYGKENILNHDAVIMPLRDIPKYVTEGKVFLRPVKDHKAFAGTVGEAEYLKQWVASITAFSANTYTTLNPDTEVAVSSLKDIHAEYRSFVIDGKVITTSLYKRGDRIFSSDEVEPVVVEYTQRMVDLWQPSRAFVIDVALTPEGYKIIELNGFGSSGFYACDAQKIIAAIEELKI